MAVDHEKSFRELVKFGYLKNLLHQGLPIHTQCIGLKDTFLLMMTRATTTNEGPPDPKTAPQPVQGKDRYRSVGEL